MLIKCSILWTVTLNVCGWLAIQLVLAWLFLRLPARWFAVPVQKGSSRVAALVYEKLLRVKSWKHLLPDGAPWFPGGFAKARLQGKSPSYLNRFVAETLRAEICHWFAIACVPVFALWNPWWGLLVNALYALIANLPCILVQRYNRRRFNKVLRTHILKNSYEANGCSTI